MADRVVIENPSPLQPKNFPYRVLPFPWSSLQQWSELSPLVASDNAAPEVSEEGKLE